MKSSSLVLITILFIAISKHCDAKRQEFAEYPSLAEHDGDTLVQDDSALVIVSSNQVIECVGTLFSESLVVVPAHCLKNPKSVTVAVSKTYDPDEYVQEHQINVSRVIIHSKFQENNDAYNIALLKLEKPINSVIPACLWLDSNIPYSKPVITALAKQYDPVSESYKLDKIQITNFKLLNNTECMSYTQHIISSSYTENLLDNELCIFYRSKDSRKGLTGHLSFNLIYENHIIPFVFGIRSSRTSKSKFKVQVTDYATLSQLAEWIKETMRYLAEEELSSLFDPSSCAKRYLNIRHQIEGSKLIENINPSEYMVLIQNDAETNQTSLCAGVLMKNDMVITLAQCASNLIPLSSRVVLYDSSVIQIRDVLIHPKYKENSFYNNIALLKLVSRTTDKQAVLYFKSFESGSISLLGYRRNSGIDIKDFFGSTVKAQQLSTLFDDDCNPTQEQRTKLDHGPELEHMCLQNDQYLFPGSCVAIPGSPVVLSDDTKKVVGLYMAGHHCGFGEPAIAVLFYPHLIWLYSITVSPALESLTITIPSLKISDKCVYPEGTKGTCVTRTRCPVVKERLDNNLAIFFCTDKSVVCCPQDTDTEDDVSFAFFRA